jgi:hypothetical protein
VRSASSSRGAASVFLFRAIAAAAADEAARIEEGKRLERVCGLLALPIEFCFPLFPLVLVHIYLLDEAPVRFRLGGSCRGFGSRKRPDDGERCGRGPAGEADRAEL